MTDDTGTNPADQTAPQVLVDPAEHRRLMDALERTNRELQRTVATLQISEEKLAVTLNSIGDAVITTDTEAIVTMLNPLAEHLTGWLHGEAIGRPIVEVFRIIGQETREVATVPVLATLAHGTVQGLANHTILISRSGDEFSIADSCAPIRERNGTIIGAVLVFRDVTAEHEGQRALRDSSDLLQTILSTVTEAIITLRADDGIIDTVNPAAQRMFGYGSAELLGQPIGMLVPSLRKSESSRFLAGLDADDDTLAAGAGRDVMGQRKDGSQVPLEMALSEMSLLGHDYFTGTFRDMTERKRMRLALEAQNDELRNAKVSADMANDAKSDFLSKMSHELRSPLNAILGFAQLMDTDEPPATSGQKASIQQILHAGWYLLELINEILDLAVIESGRVALSIEPVLLDEVMDECLAMIEQQAQKREIKLNFPVFPTPTYVRADRLRLKQVLLNLLSNAIKYNQPGGSVEIRLAAPQAKRVRINVVDTGHGLAPEKLLQLFQPFNRLGQEGSHEQGTGIGLVMCKLLVELMGGTMGVESVVDTGSMFWFELPSSAAPAFAAESAPVGSDPSPLPVPIATPHTLLYIEDNIANLKLVEQLVGRRRDLEIRSADNAVSGIQIARDIQPTVILMDINLGGINGFQALALLRSDAELSHIPVLAITANAMMGDRVKGLEAGFFRYLTKPIIISEFMEALDGAMEFARSRPAVRPRS